MADILVRGVEDKVIKRLKARAKLGGRSLQGEVRSILESATATYTREEAVRTSKKWHRRLTGRITGDSADLIREDRGRVTGPALTAGHPETRPRQRRSGS